MFTGLESPLHLLVVLVVAALVFGPKKLPDLGRSLGSGIRQFKGAVTGEETITMPPEETAEESPPAKPRA
jgi:sec-independent protein translocase protein TatA